MRLNLTFISEKQKILSSSQTLRNNFISFLKKTFQSSSYIFYNKLFNKKQFKPYVFSVWYGKNFNERKVGPQIKFIFSSGDCETITHFWNGLLVIKNLNEDYFSANSIKFSLKNINITKQIKINSDKIVVETIGITVVTNPNEDPKNFDKWYLVPKKSNIEFFNEILTLRTKQRYEFLLNKKMPSEVILEFTNDNDIKECVIPHYGGYIKGFKGRFILKSSPEVLQFLYDYGLGVRTGQGFGLIDIVKQQP